MKIFEVKDHEPSLLPERDRFVVDYVRVFDKK